ncbi:MAG TPA: hypothetical protein VN900_06310 [Stellaceae bacterium]|jgi:hypothetical protein|nr:hypothetical protein [Stellaceae bacterium]
MRYSKRALLIFGAGLLLGLIFVSANLSGLGRGASLAMATGIMLLPIALVADWWSHRPWHMPKPKAKAKKKPAKRRTSPARSSRPRTKR